MMRLVTPLLFAFAAAACSDHPPGATGEVGVLPVAALEEGPLPDGCDPAYWPCVPRAADVDCEGGPGDGPALVRGPVEVVTSDPYELDEDGDGTGCE